MDQSIPSETNNDTLTAPKPVSPRPWVKPTFERIPLNEATTNSQTIGDDGISQSGS